jgi:hypothetical protein
VSRALLPADRDLTPDEAHGFRIACACFESFGRQLAGAPVSVAGPTRAVPRDRMQDAGQVMIGIARALDLTLGRPDRRASR